MNQLYSDKSVKQGRSKGSSGRDKFQEPKHISMPPSIEAWVLALQSVDADPNRIKESASIVKGYRFPDPGLFISTSNKEVYLATWLSSRAAWMSGMAKDIWPGDDGPTHVPAQWWRDFLRRGCFRTVHSPQTPEARQSRSIATTGPTKTQRRNEEVTKIFRRHMDTDLREVESVFWKERRLTQGDFAHLDPRVIAEILWDLYEHNWRLELLTLDRTVQPLLWRGEDAYKRDLLLKSLFHNNDYLVSKFPTSDCGLASKVWQDRAPYIKIFREILSTWPGLPHGVCSRKLTSPVEVSVVEKALADFYCQTFYDHFGRAPITPHRLPLHTSG